MDQSVEITVLAPSRKERLRQGGYTFFPLNWANGRVACRQNNSIGNLNIHCRKSLTYLYGAEMAVQVWDRFTVHHTPYQRNLAQSGRDRNRELRPAMW